MSLTMSVIIPTHDRKESLLRLLSALGSGALPVDEFEVIVVADACTDDTVSALSGRTFPFAFRVLEQRPGRGPGPARNLGATDAKGAILVFMDDDIEPFPETLVTHKRIHAASGEVVVIGAPVPIRDRGKDYLMIATWGWWEQKFAFMSRPHHRFTYDEVFTGVLSLPAALFTTIGGFDDHFARCHEDSELGLRLLRRGTRVVFSRDAGGTHHEARSLALLLARKREEGVADVRLVRRYPWLWPAMPFARHVTAGRGYPARVALSTPVLGDFVARMLSRAMRVFEALKLRWAWHNAHGAIVAYSYWRGVVSEAGELGQLHALRARAVQEASGEPPRVQEVDLDEGLEAIERRIDAERPDSLRVRLGDLVVGELRLKPGAEPLRGAHLRALLASELANALSVALASADGARADDELVSAVAAAPRS